MDGSLGGKNCSDSWKLIVLMDFMNFPYVTPLRPLFALKDGNALCIVDLLLEYALECGKYFD
jgi:hypothetical protein